VWEADAEGHGTNRGREIRYEIKSSFVPNPIREERKKAVNLKWRTESESESWSMICVRLLSSEVCVCVCVCLRAK